MLRGITATIGEVFSYLWARHIWWLYPVVFILMVFAVLIILGSAAGVGPFIYPLF